MLLSAGRRKEGLLDSAANAAMTGCSAVGATSALWIAACLQCIFVLIFKSMSTSSCQNPQRLWQAAKFNLAR